MGRSWLCLLKACKRALRSSVLLESGENVQKRCKELFAEASASGISSCSLSCSGLDLRQDPVHQQLVRNQARRRYGALSEACDTTSPAFQGARFQAGWGGSWRLFCGQAGTEVGAGVRLKSAASCGSREEVRAERLGDVDVDFAHFGDGGVKGGPESLEVSELERMVQELSEDSADLGIVTLRLGQEYDAGGVESEKVLDLANRALSIFEKVDEESVEVGMCLHLISSVYYKLGEHDTCLVFLERAKRILEKQHGSEFSALKFAVYFLFGDAFTAKRMFEEALACFKIGISFQEAILTPGHIHLGNTYRHLAEAYAQVMQLTEAVSYAEKALEIHAKYHGPDSTEEVTDHRLLSFLYGALDDYSKALEHQKRVKEILKKNHDGPEVGFAEISIAELQVNLGAYDDAIATLTSAQADMVVVSLVFSLASVALAKAFARMNRMEKAKELCDKAIASFAKLGDLNDEETVGVAQGYAELAAVYRMMSEPNYVIEALKTSLSFSERVQGQLDVVAGTQAQIGMHLLMVGRVDEALPYMQGAVAKLREFRGLNNHALALVLNQLGVANSELGRVHIAVGHFEEAKEIFLDVYGPGHNDTLAVFQNLVGAYSFLERWDKAWEYQEHIVTEWRKLGEDTTSMFKEAQENLDFLRAKALFPT